jgi:hypothetical protein
MTKQAAKNPFDGVETGEDELRAGRITGTCDVPASAADAHAAPAQRAARSGGLSGSSAFPMVGIGATGGGNSQVHEETEACASVPRSSQKRVMGLEPTTFTLAT